MPRDQRRLEAVLDAADRLLGARSDQMLTSEEWIALDRAVAAALDRGPEAGDALDALMREGDIDRAREDALSPDGGVCWEELTDEEARLVRERMAAPVAPAAVPSLLDAARAGLEAAENLWGITEGEGFPGLAEAITLIKTAVTGSSR